MAMRRASWRTMLVLAIVLGGGAVASAALLRLPARPHWVTYTDKAEGGSSVVHMAWITSPSGADVKITGQLNRGFIYPFAGTAAWFRPGGAPVDASHYAGVQFYARGDGKRYVVQVRTAAVKSHNYFSQAFAAGSGWRLVRIPFQRLIQTIPGAARTSWTGSDVTGVSFEAAGFTGAFSLEVKEVALYR